MVLPLCRDAVGVFYSPNWLDLSQEVSVWKLLLLDRNAWNCMQIICIRNTCYHIIVSKKNYHKQMKSNFFFKFNETLKTYNGCLKSSKPHQERRVIVEYFFCGNLLPLLRKLEKLIQIFLVSKSSKSHQNRRVIAEHFSSGNTLPLLIKLEKLNQIFQVSKRFLASLRKKSHSWIFFLWQLTTTS